MTSKNAADAKEKANSKSQALTPDQTQLVAYTNTYMSGNQWAEVDGLVGEYDALGFGETYSMDSPKMGPENDGNSDTTWTKTSYSNLDASKLLGAANDLCGSHVLASQIESAGVDIDEAKFDALIPKFCKLLQAAAQIKHRYDKYQAIKTNGITLAKRQRGQEHDFKGLTRYLGGGLSLVYKPDIANTAKNGIDLEQTFEYQSWIKWSDGGNTPLNVIKRLREMKNDQAEKCEGFGLHVINGKEVDAYLYLNVTPVSATKIEIQNCISAKFNDIKKGHQFPVLTVTAPFGYLWELEQMKEDSKQKLKDKILKKVSYLVNANKEMIDLIKKIKG